MNRRESSRSRSMSRTRSRSPSSAKASRNSDRRRTSRTPPERRRRSRNKYSRGRSRDRTRSPSSRRRSRYSDSRSRSHSSPDKRVDYRRKSSSRSPLSDRRRHENPPENRCLGVFGLSVTTTEQKLYHLFSKYGPLERVQLVIDAKTNRSRGFCFVYFENAEDAKVAKEQCSGLEIDGRLIRVDYSITLRPHTPTPGVYMGNRTRNHRKNDDRYNRDEDYRRDRYSKYRERSPSPHHRRERSRRYYRSHSRSRSRYRHER